MKPHRVGNPIRAHALRGILSAAKQIEQTNSVTGALWTVPAHRRAESGGGT